MFKFQVNDMTCSHCASTITAAIKAAAPAADVNIDISAHQVQVEGATNIDTVEQAIREAGYNPERAP